MQKPVLVELQAFHEDCPAISTVERFPDVKVVSVPTVARSTRGSAFYSRILGPGAKEAAERMRQQPNVLACKTVYAREGQALVEIEYEKNNSSLCACLDAGAVLNEPALTEGMRDTLSLIFPDGKLAKDFYSRTRGKFEFKLKSKIEFDERTLLGLASLSAHGFTQLKTVALTLTEAQRKAFDEAVARGYYQQPQKTSVAELALAAGIGPSTFAEHLRKAEAKLMPVLGQLMKYL